MKEAREGTADLLIPLGDWFSFSLSSSGIESNTHLALFGNRDLLSKFKNPFYIHEHLGFREQKVEHNSPIHDGITAKQSTLF